MAWPVGVTTRMVTAGPGVTMESGASLSATVTVRSSRNLIWHDTNQPVLAVETTFTAEDELGFELPVTDQEGWYLGTNPVDVSGGKQSHFYIIDVSFSSGSGSPVSTYTTAPFALPTGDLSPVDLDNLVPIIASSGATINAPDAWGQMVEDAQAAADAAAASAADAAASAASMVVANDAVMTAIWEDTGSDFRQDLDAEYVQLPLPTNQFVVGNGSGQPTTAKIVPSGNVVGTTDAQTLTNKSLQNCGYTVEGKAGNLVVQCTSSTRPTHLEGRMIYETDTERVLVSDGAVWRIVSAPWTSFTPTFSFNTSVSRGRYRVVDGTVQGQIYAMSSGWTGPPGPLEVSLPPGCSPRPDMISDYMHVIGSAVSHFPGNTRRVGVCAAVNAGALRILATDASNVVWDDVTPVNWNPSVQIGLNFQYELA